MRGRFQVLTMCGAACLLSSLAGRTMTEGLSLSGRAVDPFAGISHPAVFFFVRSDCPITNRYAPELRRIVERPYGSHIDFWLVYPDPTEDVVAIENHIAEYHMPGTPLRDPNHRLVARAKVTVAPEVAVFDRTGRLRYHGRIDDRYVDVGKSRPAARTHDLEDAIRHVLAGTPVPHPETRAIGCSLADAR